MGNKNLEKIDLSDQHEILRMEVIELLVKEYPDDTKLGKAVRKFVEIKEKTKDNFKL